MKFILWLNRLCCRMEDHRISKLKSEITGKEYFLCHDCNGEA